MNDKTSKGVDGTIDGGNERDLCESGNHGNKTFIYSAESVYW